MKEDRDNKTNWELIFQKHKLQILFLLIGFALLGVGVFLIKNDFFIGPKVEILDEKIAGENVIKDELIVEISGAVEKPGVYHLNPSSRIEDLLIASGGLSANADRVWVEKNLNRAAKLKDGQKVFIPPENYQSESQSASSGGGESTVAQYGNSTYNNLININTASLSELDSLPGIGQTYAQKIIDNRPYSNTEDLLSKKIIPQSTFNKIKDKINVY